MSHKKLKEEIESFKKKNLVKSNDSNIVEGYSLLTELIAYIAVGFGLGYCLDKYFNSSPVFLIISLIFGLISVVWNIIKKNYN